MPWQTPSVRTDEQTLTENLIYAFGANGNYVEPFDPADYSDATAAAHAARDAIKSNTKAGVLKFGLGTFDLNGEIHVDAPGIKVEGTAIYEFADASTPAPQDKPTDWDGSVLRQTQAGANVLRFENADDDGILFDVGAENLILTWKSSLRESDTGHGVFATDAPNVARGIQDGVFKHLRVIGHDGDHYAWNFEHAQALDTADLRSHGGPVLRIFSDGTAVGNSNHGRIFGDISVSSASEDIFSITGNINFSNYPNLQYNLTTGENLSVYGWTISPNGNLNDCTFGILDAEEISGSTNGKNVGPIDTFHSKGVGLANPFGARVLHTGMGGFTRLRNGDSLDFGAFEIQQGSNPDPNSNPSIWQRFVSGIERYKKSAGLPGSEISAATTQGASNFNGGSAIDYGAAYLRLPSTSYNAGTQQTFYTYWSQMRNFGTETLQITPYTSSGGDLPNVTIGFDNNGQSVADEMQIVVSPHESVTATIDVHVIFRDGP